MDETTKTGLTKAQYREMWLDAVDRLRVSNQRIIELERELMNERAQIAAIIAKVAEAEIATQ